MIYLLRPNIFSSHLNTEFYTTGSFILVTEGCQNPFLHLLVKKADNTLDLDPLLEGAA